jgi:hypothetical protein
MGWALLSIVACVACGDRTPVTSGNCGPSGPCVATTPVPSGTGTAPAPSTDCGEVEPCGGDVVGTWNLVTSCVNGSAFASALGSGCPGATASASNLHVSGSITFAADMTYSATAVQNVTIHLSVSASCLGELTCDEVGAQLLEESSGDVQSASCTGRSTCTCTVVVSGPVVSAHGTYLGGGTTLQTIGQHRGFSSETTYGYCVQGGTTLHLVDVNALVDMGPMGQASIVSDIVAQKQ